MPFVLLIGAAPNAIAYESKQFTSGEFFRHGLLVECRACSNYRFSDTHNLADDGYADNAEITGNNPSPPLSPPW